MAPFVGLESDARHHSRILPAHFHQAHDRQVANLFVLIVKPAHKCRGGGD